MNVFAKAWDLLIKALDPDNFNLDDLIGREAFPKNDQTAFRYLQEDPLGEFKRLRQQRVDADLDMTGRDIAPFSPTYADKWNAEKEMPKALGGGFSSPGKMINDTYSFPTHMCMVGGRLREIPGTVCSNCYAHERGKYPLNNVQRHLLRNYDAYKRDPDRWASALSTLIPRQTNFMDVFRFHDSGDLDSAEHLAYIAAMKERVDAISNRDHMFWIPTREWDVVNRLMRERGQLPENMAVRLSIPNVNQTLDNDLNEKWGLPLMPQRHIDMMEEFPQLSTSRVISDKKYQLNPSDMCLASDKSVKGSKCADHRCIECHDPNKRNVDYGQH